MCPSVEPPDFPKVNEVMFLPHQHLGFGCVDHGVCVWCGVCFLVFTGDVAGHMSGVGVIYVKHIWELCRYGVYVSPN